jgi:hypothetical protein
MEQVGRAQQQQAGKDVGARDHGPAADRVEGPGEHQRADEIPDGDHGEVVPGLVLTWKNYARICAYPKVIAF